MPKAGIVTFFNSYNYGAQLQAYATRELFIKLGYDTEFVNYCNVYEQRNKRLLYSEDGSLSSVAKTAIKNLIFGKRSCLKRSFEGDAEINHVFGDATTDVTDLNDNCYDLLISGSDQLWNPQITNGIDRAYYLDFGQAKHRISFASSVGSYDFSNDELKCVSRLLGSFDWVSVREGHLKDQLTRLGYDVQVVPDPTLMFDRQFWIDFSAGCKPDCLTGEPYALAYFVGGGFDSYRAKIESLLGNDCRPIYNIQFNRYSRPGVTKSIVGASTREFVSLVNNASLVLTDSFHGTAFSLNMGKPFVAFNNVGNPLRVQELLGHCGALNLLEPAVICSDMSEMLTHAEKVLTRDRQETRDKLGELLKGFSDVHA